MNITECTNLADLYQQLGASVWCSQNTSDPTAEYHRKEAEKWLALISEARPILFARPVDMSAFRKLLVKYFEAELLTGVPYIAKLRYPSDWLDKELCKSVVEKWVSGDYDGG